MQRILLELEMYCMLHELILLFVTESVGKIDMYSRLYRVCKLEYLSPDPNLLKLGR